MIITSAVVLANSGLMTGVASNARRTWSGRRGLWLGLRDDAGRLGQGEASPLPGYGVDSLASARGALDSMVWKRWSPFELEADALPQIQRAVDSLPGDVPSARFAVESALLDLFSQATAVPVAALLGASLRTVSVARLVQLEDGKRGIAEARGHVAAGTAALKIKIGRPGAFEVELRFLRALRDAVGAGVALRLDANGCLGGPGLAERVAALAALDPEFLEEPAPVREVLALRDCPVALALDETLHGSDAMACIETCVGRGPYRYVVLKPTAIGGLLACKALAVRSRPLGALAVVSHTFDGPVAWSACASLAVAVQDPGVAAGLGPHAGLGAWPAVALPGFVSEHIQVRSSIGWGVPAPVHA